MTDILTRSFSGNEAKCPLASTPFSVPEEKATRKAANEQNSQSEKTTASVSFVLSQKTPLVERTNGKQEDLFSRQKEMRESRMVNASRKTKELLKEKDPRDNKASSLRPKEKERLCSKRSSSRNQELGDRFIPSKVALNLYSLFVNDSSERTMGFQESCFPESVGFESLWPPGSESSRGPESSVSLSREETQNLNYFNLLQNQILGENEKPESAVQPLPHQDALESPLQSKESYLASAFKKKMLNFKSNKRKKNIKESAITGFACSPLGVGFETNDELEDISARKISKEPYKVIKAPCLQDDFYLNLLDWSQNNYIAVGLDNSAFVWSASNSNINKIYESENRNDSICSVSWSSRGNHLAIGNSFGEVKIVDLGKGSVVRGYKNHKYRVGSIGWNGTTLATGSRDRVIFLSDLRAPTQNICHFQGHKQEICGLKWSFDEQILASGGNDNKLFLWSLKTQKELAKFGQHTAAVKAIGFSPHQHSLLASGGGTADRCIRFWNTHTLEMIDSVDTGSQVCNLVFSKTSNEIVSTHGYSLNQIIVWKYPTMHKLAGFTAHTYRVLNLALSPCGQNIVTGAGDETLKFWNIFPPGKREGSSLLGKCFLFPTSMDLR